MLAATRPSRPQQRPSSSAGAAHASSSEPAPTIRTPVERSRGGRSPRARQASQLRRLSTPHPLVQEALVLVVPASHSRLADEAGHDGEAGTAIVLLYITMEQFMMSRLQHRPALLIAPHAHAHVLSTRKVSSKLATSSSSSTAVGEKVARTTVEDTCPHRRHERRERRDQPALAIAHKSVYYLSLSFILHLSLIHI